MPDCNRIHMDEAFDVINAMRHIEDPHCGHNTGRVWGMCIVAVDELRQALRTYYALSL